MVIRKCDEKGQDRIDWVKSLVVTGVFAGVILWAVQVSHNADRKADTALVKIENLEKKMDRVEVKIDRLVERK